MDTPPVPKPRSIAPTPLPRHLAPAKENVDTANAADILSTLGTKSKQFTEGVAAKISNSAKGTLEKTKTTSRAVRDSVTKSVIEGTTAGLKLLKSRKNDMNNSITQTQRCASMPDGDVNLFENISFISPLQKSYVNDFKQTDDAEPVCFHLNHTNFDDLSLFSGTSDTNTSSISDSDLSTLMCLGSDQITYDTPRCSRANSVASFNSIPEIPERKKKLKINEKNSQNAYENFQLPTILSVPGAAPRKVLPEVRPRPSQSTIYEFDPLNASTSAPKYKGISNELLLLESFLIGDTYGTVVAIDNDEDILEYVENDYFNPPSPPERFDSLAELDRQDTTTAVVNESHSNWYVTAHDTVNKTPDVEVKRSNSMIQKFSRRLKLDNVLHKPVKLNDPEISIVERPPINHLPAPHFSGNIMRTVAPALVEELFKTNQSRYCVLSDQKLVCYSDPTNALVKEVHLLSSIYCVQVVLPLSSR